MGSMHAAWPALFTTHLPVNVVTLSQRCEARRHNNEIVPPWREKNDTFIDGHFAPIPVDGQTLSSNVIRS
jgi:hypothetical protein